MKPTIARRTRQAYFLVLLVPFLLGILVLWFAEYYRSSILWVTHTQEVLAQVDQLLLSVTEAESSQRAFGLTQEDYYVTEFASVRERIAKQLSLFRSIVADNPTQLRRFDDLRPAVLKRIEGLQRLIDLRRGPQLTFTREAPSTRREGTLIMTSIRAIVAGLKREEQRLLEARLKAQDMAEFQLVVSFIAGLLINVALLYRAYKLLIRYGNERDAAEAEIRTLNEDLEDRVEQRTAELQHANEKLSRSNEDLSRFAHVASHDLQEPLRTVASYAGLLGHRYGTRLEGDANLYLNMIISGAKRMQNQVQDLLRYSRTDAQKLRYETFTLSGVLSEVKDDLAAALQEKKADLAISGALPKFRADRTKMLQVLENLVSNALKFSKPDVPPKIEIHLRTEANHWLVAITDNGIGFEPEFGEKIFIIFQRLHSVGTYPGTGIGLAICKRIIEAHGGRIWATSTPGVGSTFSFTIPRRTSAATPESEAVTETAEKVD